MVASIQACLQFDNNFSLFSLKHKMNNLKNKNICAGCFTVKGERRRREGRGQTPIAEETQQCHKGGEKKKKVKVKG